MSVPEVAVGVEVAETRCSDSKRVVTPGVRSAVIVVVLGVVDGEGGRVAVLEGFAGGGTAHLCNVERELKAKARHRVGPAVDITQKIAGSCVGAEATAWTARPKKAAVPRVDGHGGRMELVRVDGNVCVEFCEFSTNNCKMIVAGYLLRWGRTPSRRPRRGSTRTSTRMQTCSTLSRTGFGPRSRAMCSRGRGQRAARPRRLPFFVQAACRPRLDWLVAQMRG